MTNATFTTLLTTTRTNDYGNVITTSLIHRTAGLEARGSALVPAEEAYLVRVTRPDMNTFHGKSFADKLDALDEYNSRVGVFVEV